MIKYAISNIAWKNEQNDEIYALMKKYGFTGLEIAPTKIIPEKPYSHVADAERFAKDLQQKWGFSIPSMQPIWYGKIEKIFGTAEERKILLNYTKSAVDFASAIGCKNLVFGCPKNRNVPDAMEFSICNKIAVEFFKEIGNYAFSKNICVGMEANPDIYGTNFINTTTQALELIKQVHSDGFKLNLDIGTMVQNKESIALLEGNDSLVNHVHISEPFLKKIEHRQLHNELMDFLCFEKYDGFVSIEMGLQNKLVDIEEVMKYVKDL